MGKVLGSRDKVPICTTQYPRSKRQPKLEFHALCFEPSTLNTESTPHHLLGHLTLGSRQTSPFQTLRISTSSGTTGHTTHTHCTSVNTGMCRAWKPRCRVPGAPQLHTLPPPTSHGRQKIHMLRTSHSQPTGPLSYKRAQKIEVPWP